MRAARASTKKKRRVSPLRTRDITSLYISPRNHSTTPPPATRADDLPVFSSEDTIKISVVNNSLREYIQIPKGKDNASQLSVDQVNLVRSTLPRFNALDFSFCTDEFLWKNVIQMRAIRQESSFTDDDIFLSVKASYCWLMEYRDMSREGRMMERYWLDASLIGLKKSSSLPTDLKLVCRFLSKDWLI